MTDDVEKLAKRAVDAVEAWREDTEDSEMLLEEADYALTMLRMAIGDERFENLHWFSHAHRQVIRQMAAREKAEKEGAR